MSVYNNFVDISQRKIDNELVALQKKADTLSEQIDMLNNSNPEYDQRANELFWEYVGLWTVMRKISEKVSSDYNNLENTSFLENYGINNIKKTPLSKIDQIIAEQKKKELQRTKLNQDIKETLSLSLVTKVLGLIIILVSLYFYV